MRNSRGMCVGLFSAALLLQGSSTYKVQARYPVPGTGGWDYVTLDTATRRLYISHATQVDVLDADTGKLVGTIPDTPGVHGIAIASAFKHGFTSNGRENKVSMFDPSTLELIKKIDVGKGPDGIYYDPFFFSSRRRHTSSLCDWSSDVCSSDLERGRRSRRHDRERRGRGGRGA